MDNLGAMLRVVRHPLVAARFVSACLAVDFDKEVLEGVQPIDQVDIDVGHVSFSDVIGRRIKQATTFLKDEVALVASITTALVTQPNGPARVDVC